MYSQAIAGNPKDHTLFGNRSAAFLAMGLYEDALLDATKCTQLKPDWAKGHYRLGCVLLALSQWAAAAEALGKGAELEPGDADMVGGCWAAISPQHLHPRSQFPCSPPLACQFLCPGRESAPLPTHTG